MPERVLVVVQRYGDGVAGGAEAHARQLVAHLRPHFECEVATTTALDYWTWEHVLTPGEDEVDGVRVHRFMPLRRRSRDFRRRERAAFARGHSLADERAFIEAQGPVVPELLDFVHDTRERYAAILFFTYIYYQTVYGVPLAPERAVLVPTAHAEPAIDLAAYRALFHAPRAIAYNTAEERAMVERRFGNARVPSAVVGVGVDLPVHSDAARFRGKYGIDGPFFLYVGRIVESKGCADLFAHWERWKARTSDVGAAVHPAADSSAGDPARARLVLIGAAEMAVPARDDIVHLGRVSDEDKFDALAACTALVVPSRLESLSIVTLEAWALGRPTICPATSPVLAALARRAGAGLPYGTAAEFAELCELLLERPALRARLGAAGAAFVASTYTWPRVVETYLDLFAEVRARNS